MILALRLARSGRQLLLVLIVAGAAFSTVRMAALFDPIDPSRSYYGTDTRAQALLVGAALAVLVVSRPVLLVHPAARRAAAWIGPAAAIAIVFAFLRAHEQSSFYYRGSAAVFALAVAAGLWAIEAAPRGFPGQALSLAPAAWIGTVSYGLYLWHWPVIIWLTPHVATAGRAGQAVEVAATFAAATLSFYLLERPIRSGRVPGIRRSTVRLAVATAVGVALVGAISAWATMGGSTLARQVGDTSDSSCPPGSPSVGSTYHGAGAAPATWCSRTAPRRPDSSVVAVIGDLTSRALDPGMRKVAGARGWRYIQAGINGCSFLVSDVPPLATPVSARQARSCAKTVPRLLRDVEVRYRVLLKRRG